MDQIQYVIIRSSPQFTLVFTVHDLCFHEFGQMQNVIIATIKVSMISLSQKCPALYLYEFFYFIIFIFYLLLYCHITVVPIFPTLLSFTQLTPFSSSQSPPCCPHPWVIHVWSLTSSFLQNYLSVNCRSICVFLCTCNDIMGEF